MTLDAARDGNDAFRDTLLADAFLPTEVFAAERTDVLVPDVLRAEEADFEDVLRDAEDFLPDLTAGREAAFLPLTDFRAEADFFAVAIYTPCLC